jgi:chaperonin cofactor prefoldin
LLIFRLSYECLIRPQGHLFPKEERSTLSNGCSWFACWIVVFAQFGQLSLKQLLIIPIPLENPDEPGAGRHRIHQAASRRMAHGGQPGQATSCLWIELRERMVRVEEALKHQGELIQQLIQQMDKRFEQVDLRFGMIEKRFEQIDKRFEQVDKRFEEFQQQMDRRFEQVDKRFEQVDKRFEQMDQRFVELQRRMDRFMFWSLGMTLTVGGIVIAVLKF